MRPLPHVLPRALVALAGASAGLLIALPPASATTAAPSTAHAVTVNDPPPQAQRDLLKQDIVFDIDRGWAIVANVVNGWRPPGYPSGTIYHYVAVVGYADGGDSAVIADPAGAGAGGSGWNNVPKTYPISTYDLGTWIGLKAYAA